MSIKPFISILIPIYNGHKYLKKCLKSVYAQTYNNYEIIIGINGHELNSDVYKKCKNIIKSFDKNNITLVDYGKFDCVNPKSKTLNEMTKITKYYWIALLDVDDLWLPDKLQKQTNVIINRNNKFDVIGTKCQYFNKSTKIPQLPSNNISEHDFMLFNPIINSSVIIRKSLCYWEDIIYEDYYMWLDLWKNKKCNFFNINEILVKHMIHPESSFNSKYGKKYVNNVKKHFKI